MTWNWPLGLKYHVNHLLQKAKRSIVCLYSRESKAQSVYLWLRWNWLPEGLRVDLSLDDVLQHLLGESPVIEESEWDLLHLTVPSQVIVLLVLDEQDVSVFRSGEIRDTVTCKEDERWVWQCSVWKDGLGLVVAVVVVWVTVDEFPGLALLFWVGELDVVGNDVDLVGFLFANEVGEDGSDDGDHT